MLTKHVFLGLGSNVGDRESYLEAAIQALNDQEAISIIKQSAVIETEPIGVEDQGKFLNMVVEVVTSLTPMRLLDMCLEIESQNGRVRKYKCEPRTLDIDILFYDDQIIDSNDLTVPHPEVHKRHFVLAPLVEIAPAMVHPSLNLSTKAMLYAL